MHFKRHLVYIVNIGLAFVAVFYADFKMISPNQLDLISYTALAIGILGVAYNVLKSISFPENKEVFENEKNCKDAPLNTGGLYSTVKYPGLAGDFLILLSFALYSALLLYFLAVVIFFNVIWRTDIKKLNKEYDDEFGNDHIKWAKGLNTYLPNIARFRGMGKYSSWKKVNPWYPLIYGSVISTIHIYREYTVFQEFEIQEMACLIALLSALTTVFLLIKKGLAKD